MNAMATPDVVFPCGYTVATDGDTINLTMVPPIRACVGARQYSQSSGWLDANGHFGQAHESKAAAS